MGMRGSDADGSRNTGCNQLLACTNYSYKGSVTHYYNSYHYSVVCETSETTKQFHSTYLPRCMLFDFYYRNIAVLGPQ